MNTTEYVKGWYVAFLWMFEEDSVLVVVVLWSLSFIPICAGILEEPENEYDTEATKKAKILYASCVDIRK